MRPEAKKQFIKLLNGADRSRSTRESFQDFCELAYCALAKLTAPTKERADELEARYMQIVGRYRDLNTIREIYPHMMAIAMEAVMDGGVDFLGEVAGELEILDKRQEQFFTPYPVAKMMARMTLDDVGSFIERKGYIQMGEPAVGAGVMVLAAADVITELGFNPCIHMLVEAVDISPLAYYMCYLQLTWRGVPAHVIRGNSLSMEVFESAWTLPAFMFHDYHGHLSFHREEVESQPMQAQPEPEQPLAVVYHFFE